MHELFGNKKINMKILCVFGKYLYGQEERGISTEYFSFIPAFKTLGYEVAFFDSWNKNLYKNYIELNDALIDTVEIEKPDFIFTVQLGYEIWIETWDYIRSSFNIKTIHWGTDDSWKYKEHTKFLANHFDLMVTTYEEFVSLYIEQKANVHLSGWGVPIQWITTPKKGKECKYNVTFIGAAHGDRKEKVKKLIDEGIDVQCFGYGWNNGPIDSSKIPIIFNDSIISLNFANSTGENQIKARVFEVTGSGGFLMTEDAKNLNKVFTENEIITFTDINDCIKKIKFYLNNLEERDNIVFNGFRKTSDEFTYKKRVENIIKMANISKKVNVHSVDFKKAKALHKENIFMDLIKSILIFCGIIFFGKEKGYRFARRAIYEFSWRFFGKNTYKAKGLVGRMFYNE